MDFWTSYSPEFALTADIISGPKMRRLCSALTVSGVYKPFALFSELTGVENFWHWGHMRMTYFGRLSIFLNTEARAAL